MDAKFYEYAIDMLNSVDTLLFGRMSYDLMANYWSTPDAIKNDPIDAEKMNALPKIVFSRTLNKVEWSNTSLVKENIEEEVKNVKKLPARTWRCWAASALCRSLPKAA